MAEQLWTFGPAGAGRHTNMLRANGFNQRAAEAVRGIATMTEATNSLIIVGVDGSEPSEQAAFWAAAEAQRRGAALRLINAYSVHPVIYGPGVRPESINRAVDHAAAAMLDRSAAAIQQAYPGLAVTTQAREGSPVDALRTTSEHATMTVVGSHGSHQLIETLLGSVAAGISGHAHSPVVVIRTDPAGRHVGQPGPGEGPIVVGLDGSANSDDALAFALQAAAIRRTSLVAIRTWDDKTLDGFQRSYPTILNRDQADQLEQQLLAEQIQPSGREVSRGTYPATGAPWSPRGDVAALLRERRPQRPAVPVGRRQPRPPRVCRHAAGLDQPCPHRSVNVRSGHRPARPQKIGLLNASRRFPPLLLGSIGTVSAEYASQRGRRRGGRRQLTARPQTRCAAHPPVPSTTVRSSSREGLPHRPVGRCLPTTPPLAAGADPDLDVSSSH